MKITDDPWNSPDSAAKSETNPPVQVHRQTTGTSPGTPNLRSRKLLQAGAGSRQPVIPEAWTTVPSPGEISLPGNRLSKQMRTLRQCQTGPFHTYIYPLKVSENGRYLIDQNGKPFYPVVDTGWMVFSYINEEDAEYYLEQRRLHGVNTILCYGAPLFSVPPMQTAKWLSSRRPFQNRTISTGTMSSI